MSVGARAVEEGALAEEGAGAGGRLALCEASRARQAARRERGAGAHHYRVHEQLHVHFGPDAPLQAMSLGQEGTSRTHAHAHARCRPELTSPPPPLLSQAACT